MSRSVILSLLLLLAPVFTVSPAHARVDIGPEVPASPTDLRLSEARNSPALVADPTEPDFVVLAHRLDAPDFDCGLLVSGDGGHSWVPVGPVPHLPPGVDRCYAPEVVFDRSGLLYYLFVGLSGEGNSPAATFITTSPDRAGSFSAPRQVLGPERYQVRMAIDPEMGKLGRLHLVWLEARSDPPLGGLGPPPNPIMSSHSDDGGVTFSVPVQVSDSTRRHVVAPSLSVGRNHRLHVAYYDLGEDARDYQGLEGPRWEGEWSLLTTLSADRGLTFEPAVEVDNGIVPPGRVMLIFTMPSAALAADGAGRLFVAWTDAREGDPDVFIAASDDDGRSWREPRRLNDDPAGNGKDQYLPRLSIAPGGRIDAVYLDRRDDPGNVLNEVSYVYSVDAGRRFTGRSELTTEGSDSRIGQEYLVPSAQGLIEFGSRLGLLSRRAGVVAAWPDTRNAAAGTTQQDIFTTDVTVSSRGTASTSLPKVVLVAGVSICLVGVVVGVTITRRGRTRRAAG